MFLAAALLSPSFQFRRILRGTSMQTATHPIGLGWTEKEEDVKKACEELRGSQDKRANPTHHDRKQCVSLCEDVFVADPLVLRFTSPRKWTLIHNSDNLSIQQQATRRIYHTDSDSNLSVVKHSLILKHHGGSKIYSTDARR